MATLTPNKDAEVSVIQIGNLTLQSDVQAGVGAGTTDNRDWTVPAGKTWVLKGFVFALGGGTVTVTGVRITIGAENFDIVSATIGTGAQSHNYMVGNDLVLHAGVTIRMSSASGTVQTHTKKLMYIESDA